MTRASHLDRLAARYQTTSDRPLLSYIVGQGWVLCRQWHCHVNGCTITVPEGFRHDLASVPRMFWPLLGPMDLSVEAALVHDMIYQHHAVGGRLFKRREADRLLRLIARRERVPVWRCWAAWLAVRGFGWLAWRRNK